MFMFYSSYSSSFEVQFTFLETITWTRAEAACDPAQTHPRGSPETSRVCSSLGWLPRIWSPGSRRPRPPGPTANGGQPETACGCRRSTSEGREAQSVCDVTARNVSEDWRSVIPYCPGKWRTFLFLFFMWTFSFLLLNILNLGPVVPAGHRI